MHGSVSRKSDGTRSTYPNSRNSIVDAFRRISPVGARGRRAKDVVDVVKRAKESGDDGEKAGAFKEERRQSLLQGIEGNQRTRTGDNA